MADQKFVLIAAVIIAVVKGPNDAVTAFSAPNEYSSSLEYVQPVGKQYLEEYSERQSNEAEAEYSVDRRKALRDPAKLWPKATVPYVIDDSLDNVSSTAREVIEDALAHWEEHTCLRFVPYNPDLHEDYVIFQQGDWCKSKKGRIGGSQVLNLADGCLKFGSVVHEIGHLIGWTHEHKRPDRDDYVKVDLTLIPEEKKHDYEKSDETEIDTHGVPYDYGSIMHYHAKDGILEALDKSKESKMGQRNKLSFYDIKLANIIYKCAARNRCNQKAIVCRGEGYVGPKCTCLCPDGVKSCSAGKKKPWW